MHLLSLAGLAVACLISLARWQWGFYLLVLVALVQDPMRKLVPGEPPHFILFAGVVFFFSFMGAIRSRVPLMPAMITGWQERLAPYFMFYALVVLAQCLHGFARTTQPLVPVLGFISYLAPFIGLALAHAFAAGGGTKRIQSFLLFYTTFASIALTTVALETTGVSLRFLGEVGVGITIYDLGQVLQAYSGTFRASEIAAWHAATCSCVIIVLATHKGIQVNRLLIALVLVAALVALGMFTGRRKFVVIIAIFLISYVGLFAYASRRMGSVMFPAIFLGFLAYLWLAISTEGQVENLSEFGSDFDAYTARTSTVFGDIPQRFMELGIAPISWAYNHFGLFGGGAGIGTQGVQHMTQGGRHLGAAEGGLGKIMVELGVAGLVAMFLLGWALLNHILKLLRHVRRQSKRHTRLACGLTAILVSNFAGFSVATQTYGDVFVLLFLGICFGSLLAMPRITAFEVPRPQSRFSGPAHINVM